MFVSRVFCVLGLAAVISAQEQYTIDPSTVPIKTKNVWCDNQRSTCPLLCTQFPDGSLTTAANDCDPETLEFDCVCGNGLSPNMTEYSLTIPFHICIEWGQNCVASCGGVNTCQAACTEQHPCGAQSPTKVNATTTTASNEAKATDDSDSKGSDPVVYNGLSDDTNTLDEPGPATATNAAQAALDIGRSHGLSIVFSCIFAAIGYAI